MSAVDQVLSLHVNEPGTRIWGREPGDSVRLYTEDDVVEEVMVRIDARQIMAPVVEAIGRFARANALLLVTLEGNVVGSSQSELEDALRVSSASRFVADPSAFLSGLEQVDGTEK